MFHLMELHCWIITLSASLVAISAKTQFFDQVKISFTSQLVKGIFKLFQKLPKYFSGITTFALVNESLSSGVFPTILNKKVFKIFKRFRIKRKTSTWVICLLFFVIFAVFK